MAAYSLHLTAEDCDAIGVAGHRYAWSDALSAYGPGWHDFEEHEAWELISRFEEDMPGGHSPFPLLNLGSPLAGKLFDFWHSIV